MSERTEDGKFKPGHRGMGGRPPGPSNPYESLVRQVGREEMTPAQWREVFTKARDDAINGIDGRTREYARRWLSEYLIGKPPASIRFSNVDPVDEFADLSDDELRAIVAAAEEPAESDEDEDDE